MLWMSIACAITALITFAIAAGSGLGEHTAARGYVWIGVGDTAHFAADDLLCVNEPASGARRFGTAGVACSSDAQPYRGYGFWFTRAAAVGQPRCDGRSGLLSEGHGVLCSGRVDVRVDVEASPAFDLDQLSQGKQGRPVLRPSARTQHPGEVGS